MRKNLLALGGGPFDLTVVGAGILGTCIAWEASRLGLTVALIDRGDFGSEASGNNLRIAHGGVRDLRRLDIRRARAARGDLALWHALTPHLIEPLDVLIPWSGRAVPRVASAVTNLALRGYPTAPPRARVIDADEALALAPGVEAKPRRGALLFQDGLFYSPSRIQWALADAARQAGATVVNHVEAIGATRHDDRIVAIEIRDSLTGDSGKIATDVVVNATGVAIEGVARLLSGATPRRVPAFSYSVNIVVPELPLRAAVGLGDRRLLFFVPGPGCTAIGTAHYPVGDPPARERAAAELLHAANELWCGDPIDESDILAIQDGYVLATSTAGAPPSLADDPFVAERDAGISNLVSVAPPKYTDAPRLARALAARIARGAGRPEPASGPEPVPSAPSQGKAALREELDAEFGRELPEDVVDHTARAYGAEAGPLLRRALSEPGARARVEAGAPVIRAHLHHAVDRELALTVEDILQRRTGLGAHGMATAHAREIASNILSKGASPQESPA